MSVCILINRVTFTFFELATGQTVVGAGVAGAGAGGGILLGKAILTKVEGGAATWIRTLKSSGQTWFGPQSYLSQVLRYSGIEANHLNQSGAYKVIVKEGGACIGLQGKAAVGQASEHGQFHAVLERFWDQFRTGGSKEGQQVANGGYLDALREALTAVKDKTTNAAKFTKDQIENWVQMAEKEQRGNGYHDGPGGLRPEVPRSTGAQ